MTQSPKANQMKKERNFEDVQNNTFSNIYGEEVEPTSYFGQINQSEEAVQTDASINTNELKRMAASQLANKQTKKGRASVDLSTSTKPVDETNSNALIVIDLGKSSLIDSRETVIPDKNQLQENYMESPIHLKQIEALNSAQNLNCLRPKETEFRGFYLEKKDDRGAQDF